MSRHGVVEARPLDSSKKASVGLIRAWRSSRQKYEAEIGGGPEEGTSITMGEWTVRSRRRPILSDPDKEAMAARIASFWERKGKAMEGRWACYDLLIGGTIAGHKNDSRGHSDVQGTEGLLHREEQQNARPGFSCMPFRHGTGSSSSPHPFTPLPEILFGHSFLEVYHQPSAITLRFNTLGGGHTQPVDISLFWHHDHTEWVSLILYLFLVRSGLLYWARRQLDPDLEVIKVPEASQWAAKNHGDPSTGE